MDFSQLDPSAALAFYFKDRHEFNAFCKDKEEHEKLSKKNDETDKAPIGTSRGTPLVDGVTTAKRHYSSLFGILEVPPTLHYCGDDSDDTINGRKRNKSWEIDSGQDDDDDEDYLIV
jgi:hypothetical protein